MNADWKNIIKHQNKCNEHKHECGDIIFNVHLHNISTHTSIWYYVPTAHEVSWINCQTISVGVLGKGLLGTLRSDMKQCANQNGKQFCRPCRAWSTALAGPLHRKIPSINSSNLTCDKAAAKDNDMRDLRQGRCCPCYSQNEFHQITGQLISTNRIRKPWTRPRAFVEQLKIKPAQRKIVWVFHSRVEGNLTGILHCYTHKPPVRVSVSLPAWRLNGVIVSIQVVTYHINLQSCVRFFV